MQKERGLIDQLAYEDQLPKLVTGGDKNKDVKIIKKYAKKRLDTDFSGIAGLIKLMDLLAGIDSSQRVGSGPRIAVIYATGAIMSGTSSQGGLMGAHVLGSDTFIKAVQKAADDDQVKAIVVRVDSPGGSALASDLMWACSGRIWKATGCQHGRCRCQWWLLYFHGSRTHFCGTRNSDRVDWSCRRQVGRRRTLQEDRYHHQYHLPREQQRDLQLTMSGFTESERAAVTKLLYAVYKQFTEKAASGRKMDYDKLEKLARGRVYTGSMALKNGLVDELGTLDEAIEYARKLGKIPEGEKFEKLILPRPTSPFEQLFGTADTRAQQSEQLSQMLKLLSPELSQQLKKLDLINLLTREKSLTLMPFDLRVN